MFDEDFDPRGCQVLLALTVCFLIALGAALWSLI